MAETFDLSTLFERDDVKRTDGSKMFIRHKQELSIMQRHHLDAIIKQIADLDNKADKTEDDAESGSRLVHELADVVLVDPPADLEDWECASIFAFWLARSTQEDGASPPPKPRTNKPKRDSSRGSRPSTAATRKRGSTRPRSS